MAEVIVIGGGLGWTGHRCRAGRRRTHVSRFSSHGLFWVDGLLPTNRPWRGMPSPSTTASTSCCAAASTCWIFTAAWASRIEIAFYREFIFIEPGAGAACALRLAASAGAFRRIVSEPEFLNLSRKTRGRCAAIRAIGRQYSKRTDLDRSPCSTGSRKSASPRAPSSASGVRSWSAPSTRNWIHGRRPRLPGVPISVSWRATDSYEMGMPAVPLGRTYGSKTVESSATWNSNCARPSNAS